MNKDSISKTSMDDEYPEVTQADFDRAVRNFSISPGKKTKVSQIQLQLNRQIESFVDDEITKIRNFIQAG